MLSEEKSSTLISNEQPLSTIKSLKMIQTIKLNNNNSLSKKSTKKMGDTSRSISIGKVKANNSNEKDQIKFRSSKKKKISKLNIKIKSSYRNDNTNGNNLFFRNMFVLSSSEEKNNSKLYKKKNYKEKNKINIVEETSELKTKTFYYRLFKSGNDISTIKKCFEFRENWQLAPESFKSNEINFIWAPLSCQVKYDEIDPENNSNNTKISTLVNHYEYHTQLSNKLKMFKNLMIYCEENHLDLFSIVPLTILIEYQSSAFLRQFNCFSYVFNNITSFISESGKEKHKKYRNFFYVDNNSDTKIGLKTPLYIPKNHYNGKNLWLIKAMNLNRGLAIKIVDSIESCENIIKNFYQGGIYKSVVDSEKKKDEEIVDNNKKVYFKLPKIVRQISNGGFRHFKNHHGFCLYRQIDYYNLLKNNVDKTEQKKHYQSKKIILQKYIENPLLYNGRKFDMRIWVLISYDMKVYIFKEGHLKATSCKYSLDNKDFFVHLTNYSVQKYGQNFQKFEVGNEISFDEFQSCLLKDYNLNIEVRKEILDKIKNIIAISMKAVQKKININNRKGCFEIFGYDFMFDVDLNPYLIEINTNPGLEISSPLISRLVPRLIDDALRLTIDEVFGTIYSSDRYKNDEYISPFHVDGYSDFENMFDLIVDLNCK
jgi:hypothetical protein